MERHCLPFAHGPPTAALPRVPTCSSSSSSARPTSSGSPTRPRVARCADSPAALVVPEDLRVAKVALLRGCTVHSGARARDQQIGNDPVQKACTHSRRTSRRLQHRVGVILMPRCPVVNAAGDALRLLVRERVMMSEDGHERRHPPGNCAGGVVHDTP